jgi:hypothetical protein
MAVALRGAAVVPTGNPTTGYTCVIPATVVAGDTLWLPVESRDHTAATAYPTVTDNDTGGNAWARFAESADRKLTVWWKRATATTASKTVTVAGCVGSASGVLKCFSGALATGNPFANVVVEANAIANETHAGFTPAQSDCMVCAVVGNHANDNAVTALSFALLGAAVTTEKLSTGGADCGLNFGHVLQAAGPSATGNLTWTQADGATNSITWAILPAVAESVGTLSSTLGALAIAATVTLAVVGSTVSTLAGVGGTRTGTVAASASAAVTLAPATLTGSGTVASPSSTGTLDATLGALSGFAAGTVQVVAGTTRTLGALSLASNVDVLTAGNLASSLGAATASGSGQLPIIGSAVRTLGFVTANGSGAPATVGIANVVLAPVTVAASGVAGSTPVAGSLSTELGAVQVTASGATALSANVSALLDATISDGAGSVQIVGASAIQLAPAVLNASSTAVFVEVPDAAFRSSVGWEQDRWPTASETRRTVVI